MIPNTGRAVLYDKQYQKASKIDITFPCVGKASKGFSKQQKIAITSITYVEVKKYMHSEIG